MFTKKVLSLLFVIGSQLAMANAACVLSSSDGSDCTVGEGSVCSPGYYLSKSESNGSNYSYSSDSPAGTGDFTKVIKYDGSECTVDNTEGACADADNAGNISSNGLCAGDGANGYVQVAFQTASEVNYLIPKAEPFTDDDNAAKTHIVVKSVANSFILNGEFNSGEYEDCFTSEDGKIMTSLNNLCAESACDSYYSCTSGLCAKSEETCVPPAGGQGEVCDPEDDGGNNHCKAQSYYVKGTTLFYCETANAVCTPQDTPLGVFKDAATDGNYITCTRSVHAGRRRSATVYDYTCTSEVVATQTNNGNHCGAVGDLYYAEDTEKYYVCLAASGEGIELGTASEYMVNVGTTALFSVQVSKKFVNLILDNKGNASIAQYNANGKVKSAERYKYTNSHGLVFARNAGTKTTQTVNGVQVEGVCDVSGALGTTVEYKRDFCSSHDTSDALTDIVEYYVAVNRQ